MNRLTVIGRIVRDTELRAVGDGRIVMNNTIAIPRTFKTDKGQDADFINFVAWGRRAELIEEYCNKGDLVGFDGRIQSRSYENDQNQTVYTVEMVVESVHFLQTKRKSNRTAASPQAQNQTQTQTQAQIQRQQPQTQNTNQGQNHPQAAANSQGQQNTEETQNTIDISHMQTANNS